MLGPNSSLNVYRYDGGTFTLLKRVPAPSDRDIRDPHFYFVGDELRIKALARLPVVSLRDSDVDTVPLMVPALDDSTDVRPSSARTAGASGGSSSRRRASG